MVSQGSKRATGPLWMSLRLGGSWKGAIVLLLMIKGLHFGLLRVIPAVEVCPSVGFIGVSPL